MREQKRNIITLWDNATSHAPDLQLSNVCLKFLSADTTSHRQPLDQGIIRAFKARYRRHVLRYLVSRTEDVAGSAPDLCKQLTLLDTRERDVAQSIACPPLKRSVVGSILLSGPSCSLGYFPFQPVVHNCYIKGRGMYCSVYGKVHIKDPLLLIEKSSLCGGIGFPSKKCVNVTI